MKSIFGLAALLAGMGCALAQTYHTEAKIDVKLNGNYTLDSAPTTKGTRTTYYSKIQTYKVTNTDVMVAYRDAGYIPETDGWKLMAITRQGATSYVLRKGGRADVPVSFLVLGSDYGSAQNRNQVEDSQTGTVSSSIKYIQVTSGEMRAGQMAITFVGKANGNQNWRTYPTDAFYVSGPVTLTIIGGSGGSTAAAAGTIDGTITRNSENVIKEN